MQTKDGKKFAATGVRRRRVALGTPFSELEDVSMELAHHLARSLMQQAAQNQADQEVSAEYEVCPGCSKRVEKVAPCARPLVHERARSNGANRNVTTPARLVCFDCWN